MSSSRRTYDTDNITLRTVFAKNPGNVNVPALRVLTADGTGSCYWAIPSSLGQNPSFNEIITSAGTYTADLSYNKFRLLAGENIGMVNGAPGSNQTTLFGKAFSQIDISGDNTVYAFWENQLHSAFKIAGEGGIQVSADPTTQTIFINGPSGVINVSTGIYGFNQVKVTPTTSTITSNILNYGGDFITATSPSSLLRFLGYNDIILSTNVTRDAVFFTISTFTSQDYLAISNVAYAAYPSTLSTVSSLYVQQTLFNSTIEYLSSYSGFGFSSVVSSINALALSTGEKFYTLTGLINANTVAIGNLSNAVAQTNLNIISTVAGLGSAGYLSTAGGGSGDVTSAQLKSTVIGLGTSGYLSTGGQGLFSTVYINLQPQDAPPWNSNVPTLGFDPEPNPLALDIFGSARILKDLYVGSTTTIIGTGGVSSSNILTNVVSSGTSVVSSLGFINPADGQTLFLQVVGGSLQFNNTPVGSGVPGVISTPNLNSTITGLGLIYPSTLSMMSSINASVSSLSTALGAVGGGNLTTNNLISTVAGLGQLYPSTLSMMSSINASMSSFSTAIGPIAAGGVTQIVAGTNISISPLGGTGIVTINASGASGVTSDNLVSTVTGLGLIYPSTLSMMSSINAAVSSFSTALGPVGGGGINNASLLSTVAGLGQTYVSTQSLVSTTVAFQTAGFLSTPILFSTVAGLGQTYVSTPSLVSTTLAFQTAGFLSTPTLFSTVAGLGQSYVSTPSLVSTTVAFQTAGFLSSPSLFSTVTGLGQIYVSTLSTVNVLSSLLVNTSSLNAFYGNISSLTTSSMTAVNVAPSPVDLWVAVGSTSSSAGSIQYSSDGINWSDSSSGGFSGNSGYGVAWNGTLWVAVGDNGGATGSIKYSRDGNNWTNNSSGGFTQSGRYVAWNGRIWIAVGENAGATGSIQYSTDGSNWTNSVSGGFTNGGFGVAWNGRIWVAVGDNGGTGNIQYSTDGLNWSNSSVASFTGSAIAWNGRLWIAVGTGLTAAASIQYSYDGINWSNFISGTGFDNGGAGVAWNGQMWVAVGGDQVSARSIKYSYDGLNWFDSASGAFPIVSAPNVAYGETIAWNGKFWVAGGAPNAANTESLKYSFDGMNWTNSSSGGFTTGCYTVAYSADPKPAYKQGNFEIEPQNIPSFLTSTNQISFTASTMALNNTLFVDQFQNKVGVNIGTPGADLDVLGIGRATIFSTLLLNASSINSPGLNLSNISSLQVVASSIRAPVLSSFQINASSIISPSISTLQFNASSITSAFLSTQQFNASTVTAPFMSTIRLDVGSTNSIYANISSLNISSMNLVNIAPSATNLWVGVGANSGVAIGSIQYSTDGINWANNASGGFTGLAGRAVVWNGRIWVAVGQGGSAASNIQYSTDGINWTASSSGGFSSSGRGVAWNGRIWVAVGNNAGATGSIKYSSDGINWANNNSGGFSTEGRAVAWNGRYWVAVGSTGGSGAAGTIQYSFDGINWTNANTTFFSLGMAVAWNGRIWVANGGDSTTAGSLKYSADGINWSNSVSGGFVSGAGAGVAWNGRMWVAVGQQTSGSIQYSFDGSNWSNANFTFSALGYSVAWNGSLWVAGGNNAGNSGSLVYSRDGVNWTANASGGMGFVAGIAYSSNVVPSYNQTNFEIQPQNIPVFLRSTNQMSFTLSSIILNNTLFVDGVLDRVGINIGTPATELDVLGTARANAISTQQFNASSITAPVISTVRFDAASTNSIYANISSLNISSMNLVNIAPSSRSLWVAVGSGTNNILISANGISWSPSGNNGGGTGGFTTGRGVAWNGILWVAVGAAGSTASSIQYSSDGFNWTNSSSGGFSGTNGGYAVAWNGRLWVAVGIMNPASATGSIKYSSDGINWTNNSSGGFTGSTGGRGIAWNGRIWVAVGDMGGSSTAGSIQYSINGINWTNASSTFVTIGRGIAWNGLMWVAVGNNGGSSAAGSIRYSYDGINWFNANSTFATSGNAVAWNGRYWVAVGDNNGTALGSIRFSLDGINWTNNSTGGFAGFSSVGGGNTIAWNGSLWVAGGDNGLSPGALQYSVDGINWTVSSGSIFSGEGNGVAFSYNPTPSYNQTNFEILPQDIPIFLRSTNQLAFTTSSIIVNNTLFVDGALERVGINTGIPGAELDVNGTSRALVISTLLLNASSITSPGLNLSNISSLQVVASSIRAPVMSTQQLNASSITAPVISSLRINTSSVTTFALSASTITSISSMTFGTGTGWLVMGAVQAAVISSIQQNTALSYLSSLYVGSTTTAVTNYTAYLNGNVLASTLMIGNPITNFSTQGFRLALTHDSALKPFTTAWNTVSDKRVKENIRDADIDRCYEDIKALPLRRFTWQESIFNSYSGSDRNVIGFIAQEVSTIIPKSVNVMEAYGYQDFQFLNIDQINMSFYGALKRTIQDKEVMDSTIKGQRVEIETLKGTTTCILSTLEGLQGR